MEKREPFFDPELWAKESIQYLKELTVRPTLLEKRLGMNDYIHSGDIGDIIYGCAVMKQLGKGVLHLCCRVGVREQMTLNKAERIKTLLHLQPYLSLVQYHDIGYKQFFPIEANVYDFDDFRLHLGEGVDLIEAQAAHCKLPIRAELYEPWLTAPVNKVSRIVIHRSPRYHSSYFPWQGVIDKCHDELTMVGSPDEHRAMQKRVGRKINYRPTRTLIELASVINGAEIFIGNQSAPLSIALGLGKQCAYERFEQSPNCDFPVARLHSNPYDLI